MIGLEIVVDDIVSACDTRGINDNYSSAAYYISYHSLYGKL